MKTWILATFFFCGQLHAIPLMGGNSGGGGMLSPPEPMSEYELAEFIREKIPTIARRYFNFVNVPYVKIDQPGDRWVKADNELGDDETLNRSAYQKVFRGSSTILDRMVNTKITIQTEPCFDPVTKASKNASAFADENELCFDVRALLANIPSRSLRSDVTALAIHEYSHLMLTTEEEAGFIEKWAKASVAVDGVIFGRVEEEWKNIREEWQNLVNVNSLAADVDALAAVPLAFRSLELAVEIRARITRVFDLMVYSGLSDWTSEQLAKGVLLSMKTVALESFKCSLPEIKSTVDKQGCTPTPGLEGDVATVDDFARVNQLKFLVPVKGVIRNLSNGDRVALKAELDEVAQLLRELFKDLPDVEIKKQ